MKRPGIRLSIVIPDLRCGGVQRAAVTMAGALSRRGYRVTVLTFGDDRSDSFSLPPDVARVPLGLMSATPTPIVQLLFKTPRRLRALRIALLASAPQIVIAHATQINVPTLLALAGSRLPVIVMEHGDVATTRWKKAAWRRLRRLCYPFAFAVVSVSEAVDGNVSWLPRARRAVIANPIVAPGVGPGHDQPGHDQPPYDSLRQTAGGDDFIVSMGPLSHAKGFDILIAAFAHIAADFPQWRLVILGDGELRAALERQASELRLSERVTFAGAVAEPREYLRRAKLFVMASRYEGFPLAHGEALACGLPVIATDCPNRPLTKGERCVAGGVRELLRRSVDGVLVPSEDPIALARAMADLMSDPVRRELLTQRGPEVLARFSPEKIFDEWENLIAQAASSRLS